MKKNFRSALGLLGILTVWLTGAVVPAHGQDASVIHSAASAYPSIAANACLLEEQTSDDIYFLGCGGYF